MRELIQIALIGLAVFLFVGHLDDIRELDRKVPALVGYNCVGATGPIYAFEEDHLPQCVSIEAY